ncbi:MAG: 3'-5' exonuclease [Mameliella sp.]|nr:3'-5' exonuclease [Mameliella sp.]
MTVFFSALDFETTGLDYDKGDRIIEACIQVWRMEDRKKVIDWTQLISNQGQRINPRAQKVHGITADKLIGAPKFEEVAPKIVAMLSRSVAVVTHNGEWFDLPFLAHELAGVGRALPGGLESFDTMQNGMFASYDTKPPSLQELCWAMGVEYDSEKAHAASYDVTVMMESFFKAVDFGFFDINHLLQKEAA